MDPVPNLPSPEKTKLDPKASNTPPQTEASGQFRARTVTRRDEPSFDPGALKQPAPAQTVRAKKKHTPGTESSPLAALSAKALKQQQTRERLASKKGAQAVAPAMPREHMEREVITQVNQETTNRAFNVPPATRVDLTNAAQSRLLQMTLQHPGLVPMLELALAGKLTVSGSGPGDISVHLGTMTYSIDLGENTGQQIQSLEKLCTGYPGGQVIMGWCVGNRLHSKPGLLVGALSEHHRVLAESNQEDRVRLTVHSAEYQSQWNTEVIAKHFAGLKRHTASESDVLGERQLVDESRRRFLDGKRYEAQAQVYLRNTTEPTAQATPSTEQQDLSTPVALPERPPAVTMPGEEATSAPSVEPIFDALVTAGGGKMISAQLSEEKKEWVAVASAEIRQIVEKLRYGQEDECVAFRQALADRQLVLMQYARQKLLKKQVKNERSLLQQNEKTLVDLAKQAFVKEGPEKQRRAELVLHGMDVLEQIAVGAFDPEQYTKSELRSGHAALSSIFPEVPQDKILDRSAGGFYDRLFDAMADEKSTAYMGAQEYEFSEVSRDRPILCIYPSDPGPFLTEEARPRVSTLVGQALNQSGEELAPVVAKLRGDLAASGQATAVD